MLAEIQYWHYVVKMNLNESSSRCGRANSSYRSETCLDVTVSSCSKLENTCTSQSQSNN